MTSHPEPEKPEPEMTPRLLAAERNHGLGERDCSMRTGKSDPDLICGQCERLLRQIAALVHRAQAEEARRVWGLAAKALDEAGYTLWAMDALRDAQASDDEERGRT